MSREKEKNRMVHLKLISLLSVTHWNYYSRSPRYYGAKGFECSGVISVLRNQCNNFDFLKFHSLHFTFRLTRAGPSSEHDSGLEQWEY